MKVVFGLVLIVFIGIAAAVGGDKDVNGCIPSAGYVWCGAENKCVKPWLLQKSLGLKNIKDFFTYCNKTEKCLASAGYSWCPRLNKCVQPWVLAQEENIKLDKFSVVSYCAIDLKTGGKDENGCVTSAGYSYCEKLQKCIRPWVLAKEQNIESSVESVERFCTVESKIGGEDENGCLVSAGYSYCAKLQKCIRPWILAKQENIDSSVESVAAFCAVDSKIGGEDENGCLVSAGYSYCAKLQKCIRPWILAKEQNIDSSAESVATFCASESKIGGKDENGCLVSAGYSYCAKLQKCVHPWILARQQNIDSSAESVAAFCAVDSKIGGENENGCLVSAGYSYCAKLQKCVHPWILAKEQNIDSSAESVAAFCAVE